jgi:hypothetical protein
MPILIFWELEQFLIDSKKFCQYAKNWGTGLTGIVNSAPSIKFTPNIYG